MPQDGATLPTTTTALPGVGRLGLSPRPAVEVGLSLHTGPYNSWEADGLAIADKRNLSIFALDWEVRQGPFEWLGECALAAIDVPEESAIFQSSQRGYYAQLNAHFGRGWIAQLPRSHFTGIVRYGLVDFDADIDGDSHRRLSLGPQFSPRGGGRVQGGLPAQLAARRL